MSALGSSTVKLRRQQARGSAPSSAGRLAPSPAWFARNTSLISCLASIACGWEQSIHGKGPTPPATVFTTLRGSLGAKLLSRCCAALSRNTAATANALLLLSFALPFPETPRRVTMPTASAAVNALRRPLLNRAEQREMPFFPKPPDQIFA